MKEQLTIVRATQVRSPLQRRDLGALPLLVLATAAGILLSVSYAACAGAESRRPIRLGLITDLSGPAAYLGRKSAIGAALAEEELRAAGREVRVILGDCAFNEARRAVTEAQKLINADNVDALMTNFTPIGTAVSPVAKTAGRLLLYTAAALGPLQVNTDSFKSYVDYRDGCELMAGRWKKQGITKVGIMKPAAEYGDLCLEGLTRVFPAPQIVDYQMREEVRTQVLSLKAQGVAAVMNATYEGDLLNMLKVMKELRFSPSIATEDSALTARAITQYPELLDRALSFGMPPAPDWFVKKVLARDIEKTPTGMEHAVMTYLHVQHLVAAVAACPTHDLKCQTARLASAAADPAFGFLGFGADRIARFSWKVRVIERGRQREVE